ncbi:MAG TPA: FKBP-type peptidyl-prolyl cis-trans isomerase [Verrucomicrobiae bacterium]|nr:FKBP-type peptidyl-prolyl cis-trans isomerase [Verrucomicrobiae bacterium]
MSIGSKLVLVLGLALPLSQCPLRAEDKPAFKDEKEKVSYAIGAYFGNQIKKGNMEVDADVVVSAMKDVLAGKEPKLNDQEGLQTIRAYQMESRRKLAEKNKEAGEKFLAENKTKDGVKTHTVTLPDGKTAEMQYKVLKEGTGEMPKSNDVVTVTYRGTLLDGTEFDSSAKHGGAPLKRPANQLIRGWTEALQMMKVGSKWEIFLPSTLAYGDGGTPAIQPGSTLVFEMELLGVEAPHPPAVAQAHPQPLTSDIIKVPSAEELKKGAKIEVIKPEDVPKHAEASGETKK